MHVGVLPDLWNLFFNDFKDTYGLSSVDENFKEDDTKFIQLGFLEIIRILNENRTTFTALLDLETRNIQTTRFLIRQTSYYHHLIKFLNKPETLQSTIRFFLIITNNLIYPEKNSSEFFNNCLYQQINFIFQYRIPAFYFKTNNNISLNKNEVNTNSRLELQKKKWFDPYSINQQLQIIEHYQWIRRGKGFYLNMHSKNSDKNLFKNTAINISNSLFFLYQNFSSEDQNENTDSRLVSFSHGLPGVFWFLVVAYTFDPNKYKFMTLQSISKRISHTLLITSKHMTISMLQKNWLDWNTVNQILSNYLKLDVLNNLIENISQKHLSLLEGFNLQNEDLTYSTDPLMFQNEELSLDNDTLLNGNFWKINQLIGAKNKNNNGLKKAEIMCKQLFDLRKETGFKLGPRKINPFFAEGLSGIGWTLFRLHNPELHDFSYIRSYEKPA